MFIYRRSFINFNVYVSDLFGTNVSKVSTYHLHHLTIVNFHGNDIKAT